MKTRFLSLLTLAAVFTVGSPPLPAQDTGGTPKKPAAPKAVPSTPDPAAAPAEKANGPFDKKPSPKSATGPATDPLANAGDPKVYTNIGLLTQWIDVKREVWQAWLDKNPVPLDATPLRKVVETWIAAGDAELAETTLVMGRPDMRALVESFRSVWYPSEFEPGADSLPFPSAWDTRNVGARIEFDPILEGDRSISMAAALERVDYRGESPPRPEGAGVEPTDIRWPLFVSQSVTADGRFEPDQWALLGAETPLDRRQTHLTLIFVRPLADSFEDPGGKAPEVAQGVFRFEWIEADQISLNAWLGKPLADLRRAALEGGAKTLETRILRCRSGNRAKVDAIEEIIRPTEFDEKGAGNFSSQVAMETYNIGISVEIDPTFEPSGNAVVVNLAPEWTTHHGEAVHHRQFIDGEWKPDVTSPIFYTMKTTTQLAVPLDTPMLVGVMSPPNAEGWIDASRKVMLFLTVSR
ncbi:MAG: hypothetical protein H7A52_09325 [Akkermansiaceae bacterium]|nr:hypothetical protein [Akkermansiaceae bacterium]